MEAESNRWEQVSNGGSATRIHARQSGGGDIDIVYEMTVTLVYAFTLLLLTERPQYVTRTSNIKRKQINNRKSAATRKKMVAIKGVLRLKV